MIQFARVYFVVATILSLSFFSSPSLAAKNQKYIALERFWKAFDTAHNYSYRAVERYRKSLPPEHPHRIFLSETKNIKSAQEIVKSDFLIVIEKNFKKNDILVLTKLLKDPRYINLLAITEEYSNDKKINAGLEEWVNKNTLPPPPPL